MLCQISIMDDAGQVVQTAQGRRLRSKWPPTGGGGSAGSSRHAV